MDSSAPVLPPKEITSTTPISQSQDINNVSSTGFKLDPITIPDYLESLPIKNLKELIDSHELLKDFLLSTNVVDIDDFIKKTLDQIESNTQTLKELQLQLTTKIIPVQDSLVNKLEKLNDKFKQTWSVHELEMYSLLNKYSTENLIRMMNSLVLEVDDLSKTLYQSLLSSDKLSDNEITKFVDEYMESRQLYHLRREKLARIKENRVSG